MRHVESPRPRRPEARSAVVGTAGHVDHGKTSLVEALTGVDCDRLPEEKARGITIELGFAKWVLPGGIAASVVDVPGHERFVRTMVAGAAGIDVVLLCVAADDGVMPQTREHVAICELLGVRGGVVAITKSDVADGETLALVEEDVRDAVRGTFLEGAPMVRCSAPDKSGLERLAAEVARAVDACGARAHGGPAFMPIDRVFSKAGAGAIATGTLACGAIALGDELDVIPAARGGALRAKVRGLHVHGAKVERAVAPTRLAVNLRGDVQDAVARGAALASAGWQAPTRVVLAEIALLASASPLRRRTSLTLHVGTAQRAAHVTLVGADALAPGARALARIAVRAPIAAFAGQRIVLRRPELARDRTVGGGTVLDPHPRVTRGAASYAGAAARGEGAAARVRAMIDEARYQGAELAELARRVPPEDDARVAVAALVKGGAVVEAGGRVFAAALVDEAKREVLACVRALHAERPLLGGFPPGEIETRAPPRVRPLVAAALAALEASRGLAQSDGLVRDASRAAAGGDLLGALAALYARAALTPPLDEEARAAVGVDPRAFKDAITELKRRGALRALGGMCFDTGALAALKARVAAHLAKTPTMTPVEFKSVAGNLSRKFAIPLLEWLDAEGITRRQGDARVAGPAARAHLGDG